MEQLLVEYCLVRFAVNSNICTNKAQRYLQPTGVKEIPRSLIQTEQPVIAAPPKCRAITCCYTRHRIVLRYVRSVSVCSREVVYNCNNERFCVFLCDRR